MLIARLSEALGLGTAEMAKKASRSAKAADDARVSTYPVRLQGSKADRSSFEAVLGALDSDADLTAADWIAIAHQYNTGGKEPASKATAARHARQAFRRDRANG
jgi:hypothetical protein